MNVASLPGAQDFVLVSCLIFGLYLDVLFSFLLIFDPSLGKTMNIYEKNLSVEKTDTF